MQEQIDQQQHARNALQDVRRHAGGFHAFFSLRGKSMARLSHEMESVSVMPLGQTVVQLNCVWQRQSPPRSPSSTASRSAVAVSRGSSRRRNALLMAAGPRYSPLELLMPQAAEHAPQVMP